VSAAPGADTRIFALLGDPVAHSLSPSFQNAAFEELGLDALYVALRCGRGELRGLLRGLALAGGGGNVTLPHKRAAALALDRRTPAVEATGACNTFWSEAGQVWGDNTDVEGVAGAVRSLLGRSVAGARVLLIGAGGAARAAAVALVRHSVGELVVLNRTPARARALVRALAGAPVRAVGSLAAAGPAAFDLAINATSLGLAPGDPLPYDPGLGPEVDAGLDLVYARGGETPWVRALRGRGIPACDGSEMLLLQGAAAFRRWTGAEAPLAAMREALRGAPARP
jgi:shikimate dehydrogenase